MSNSPTRSINYKPRMTQMEAYDALPRPVRDYLKIMVTECDTYTLLRQCRKFGWQTTMASLRDWDAKQAKRPWWRGMPAPCAVLGIEPLRD